MAEKLSKHDLDEQLIAIPFAENYMGEFRHYFSPDWNVGGIKQ